jgi:hypothetical protein
MQQEDGGGVETQVSMQVHNHCNAFTSFKDLLMVMSILLYYNFFEHISIFPYFNFFFAFAGS